jgi:hypothetical protein
MDAKQMLIVELTRNLTKKGLTSIVSIISVPQNNVQLTMTVNIPAFVILIMKFAHIAMLRRMHAMKEKHAKP